MTTTESVERRRVVITGGTSGVGLATARLLVDRGARVITTGRSAAAIEAACRELGPRASVVRSDAGSLADLDALAERVRTELGAIDLLFLNAGMTRFIPFPDVDEEVWDQMFTVNTKGPFFAVQKLAPLVADGGAVVLTTSVADVKGLDRNSVYAASKAALRSLTRSLARELLPRNIRVNAVSPGPIDTPILETALPPAAAEQVRSQLREVNPMQRFGRPDEVARAVAFLAFDATFTTGSELPVDGGASQL